MCVLVSDLNSSAARCSELPTPGEANEILASGMRMEVVAEGVETFEQVVHLRELGIRAAQGFVFAPPLPTQAFLQLVDIIDPIKASATRLADEASGALPMFAQPSVA